MQLREHPAMSYGGLRAWPPVWVHSRSEPGRKQNGEIGILTGLIFYEDMPRRLFLIIDLERERYMGTLVLDDSSFCKQLYSILQSHIYRILFKKFHPATH
jgi:hypothetical protein